MKRVAFFMRGDSNGWLGGFSYIRNLLTAICSNHVRQIEPVLFVPPELDYKSLVGFPSVEIIRTPLVVSRHPARLASRIFYDVVKRDLTLEVLLKKNQIDALSHSSITGMNSEVPSIGWIPDFQHTRMPQCFPKDELRKRNRSFRRLIYECHRIILSSYDAQRDFESFAPGAKNKSRVLQFVSCLDDRSSVFPPEMLYELFNIDRPYFHLPNQFWTHKNHAVVVDALKILKSRGMNVLVIATGKTADYRDPSHFESLVARAKHLGVDENFRVLGVVSLDKLQSLMLNAIALINPSNFEGWSTSVEEAKSFGLSVILSDISVHIEQAPPMGRYFKAGSAEDLANQMAAAIREHDPGDAKQAREIAAKMLPERIKKFGSVFEEIAMDAIVNMKL